MPWMYPSVTTILNIIPNPFIDKWKVKRAIELKGENPDMKYEDIVQLMWGLAICPKTGERIASSDFGTLAHDRLEKLVNARIDQTSIESDPYDDFAQPVMDYFDEHEIDFVEAETLISCHEMKIAGRLDLVAKKDGKICLFDYKFRDCSGKDKGKFYDKDCYQLAIESHMYMNAMGLEYFPDIYSVCICNNTARVFVKKWSDMMLDRGIFKAKSARDFYFNDNLLTNHTQK
jgi:hypothetical protein